MLRCSPCAWLLRSKHRTAISPQPPAGAMEAELQSALLRRGTLYKEVDPALLGQLTANAERHGLDVKEAAAAFDKFMLVKRLGSQSVTADDVQVFLTSEFARGSTRAQPLAVTRPSNLFNRVSLEDVVIGGEVGGSTEGIENSVMRPAPASAAPHQRITPYTTKVAAHRPCSAAKQAHTPTTGGKFAERQNAGAVVASLNAHLEVPAALGEGEAMEVDGGAQQGAAAAAAAGQQQMQRGVQVEVLGQPVGLSDRYMVDKLEDKVAFLEGRIQAAEDAAAAALGCEVHPLATAAQQTALFVGRLCCDTEGGRLNPQSLLLEGSQRSSAGARVRLDVSKLEAFRLFPGQVLALLGTNPSGHCVVAAALLPGTAAPPPRTGLGELAAFAAATGRRGQSLVVAAGPFTSSEDLEYAPLAALLDYCAQPAHRPDLLLLLGPFVDAEHPLIRGGLVEQHFEDILAARVLAQISGFSDSVGGRTRVLLVPSTRDVLSPPVLPQPPLCEAGELPGGLPLANPSTLRLNEMVLGCTSADWLMACNREEAARTAAAAGEERLPALAAHLPAQRCYLPLFPPPLDCLVDCRLGATALAMPATPDLLVLPSDLAPFAKLCPVHQPGEAAAAAAAAGAAGGELGAAPALVLAPQQAASSLVCVNPGRLTKGASGGTFAHIHILPLPEALAVADGAPAATNAAVPHQLDKRCRVDIKRI